MKRFWIIGAIISMAMLSACGGVEEATEDPSTVQEAALNPADGETTGTDESARQRFQSSDQANLIMGTFMLEGTDLAVTPEQASELAFLWKAVRSLAESDTTSQEETEALITQIQEAMTTAQLEAMQEADYSQEDLRALMGELGLGTDPMAAENEGDTPRGEGGFGGDGPPNMEGMQPGQGGGPGGGPGGGQGAAMGDIDPEVMATMQAQRAERTGGGDRMSLLMLDPLIELLEARALE